MYIQCNCLVGLFKCLLFLLVTTMLVTNLLITRVDSKCVKPRIIAP